MTQEEFATLIDERQDTVSRIEKNPEDISVSLAKKIATAMGVSLDELLNFQKSIFEPVEFKDNWKEMKSLRKKLLYMLESTPNIPIDSDINKYIQKMIDEIEYLVRLSMVKPKVAFLGMSDAGKSTLINSLLGINKMPTSWTPTTSISVYIKHIENKPDFIKEEVWIFGPDWDIKNFENEEHCKQFKIAGGDIDFLPKYAIRQGEESEAASAIVFVDSPILKVCDLVDLPGFGTGDREKDDLLAKKSTYYADIIIYMSIANGFLRGEEIAFLKSAINSLPVLENNYNKMEPLSNLFVLASHAHTVNRGNISELSTILDKGSERLFNQMPSEFLRNKSEISNLKYDKTSLRNRFFAYTNDLPGLKYGFEVELKKLLEELPIALFNKSRESIERFIEQKIHHINKELLQLQNHINKKNSYFRLLDNLKKNEPYRVANSENLKKDVLSNIHKFDSLCVNEFRNEYDKLISVDSIIDIINEKNYRKKKQDMELLGEFIIAKLQARFEYIIKNKSLELSKIIDKYIEDFNSSIYSQIDVDLQNIKISFDAKIAFASALTGVATFGALAVWASTLGNLGAYILLAKGVSVLSALGISIAGGTAGAIATVSALGGPIVLGVVASILAALSFFAIFSGGWKKSISKKVIEECNKQDILIKFEEGINSFWKDTENAFIHAANTLDFEYHEYLQKLEKDTKNYDLNQINEKIRIYTETKDFLNQIIYISSLGK